MIRYEDMVADPTGTLNRLGEWLGIDIPESHDSPFPRSLRDYDTEVSQNDAYSSEHWGKVVTNRRIGSYQDVLTPDELAQLLPLCRILTKKFGY